MEWLVPVLLLLACPLGCALVAVLFRPGGARGNETAHTRVRASLGANPHGCRVHGRRGGIGQSGVITVQP